MQPHADHADAMSDGVNGSSAETIIYEAFDEFLAAKTWASGSREDTARFDRALHRAVRDKNFNPDEMARYMRDKKGVAADDSSEYRQRDPTLPADRLQCLGSLLAANYADFCEQPLDRNPDRGDRHPALEAVFRHSGLRR